MNSPEYKNQSPDDMFSNLCEALDNETLRSYLEQTGPLRISDLSRDTMMDPGFMEFVNEYGWPNGQNAGDIAPVRDYDDADDFWKNTYDSSDPEKFLNNFKNWLVVEPKFEWHVTESIGGAWAPSPALHRGYIVAEPLFANLREIMTNTPDERADLAELGEQHPEVKEAAYAAYRLLGRLVTKDDKNMALKMMGISASEEEITDAHCYLWT